MIKLISAPNSGNTVIKAISILCIVIAVAAKSNIAKEKNGEEKYKPPVQTTTAATTETTQKVK